ncbi:MAG: M18 family aminopeptidase [Halioglobus sp.]
MNQDEFNRQLCQFLGVATTPFHAVASMIERLSHAGFTRLNDGADWNIQVGGRYFLTRNDSALVAFIAGSASTPIDGFRMVGAHTDSPSLMVKPAPEIRAQGLLQLGVQVYGGALLNPWFDRDLSLAGRISYQTSAGQLCVALLDFREAIATIPSLAIHLDREANAKREVNPQTAIVPVLCHLAEGEQADLRAMLQSRLREEYPGSDVHQVLDYELCFYDTQPPALIGLRQEFIASARLDNLLSCFTGLQALLQCDGSRNALLVCNDHEEVGSGSTSGAQGPLLVSTLHRIAENYWGYAALVERSMMISTDNAHAIHPNFADRHDENHGPLLNCGPVIKVNASQRYATNSETSGLFRMLAAQEEVPVQSFVVRNDMGCGSTIGPISASATGIRTLDIGVPTLGMHSIRELAGASDASNLCRVLRRFYNYSGPLAAS